MQNNKPRKTVHYHHDFEATPEAVFPNFCPVKEYDWIETWECNLLYTASGLIEEGCVFVSSFFEEVGEETWVCTRYEPSRRLEFIRVSHNAVIQMKFSFAPISAHSTTMTVQLTVTGKTPQGEALVAGLSDQAAAGMLRPYFIGLEHFLATGEMLPLAEAKAIA